MGGNFSKLRGERGPERLALLFSICIGVIASAYFMSGIAIAVPEIDFQAYYFAAEAVTSGEPFIGQAVTEGTFLEEKAYVYTPITVLVFLPYALFSTWTTPHLINAVILLASFYALGRVMLRFIESQGLTLERFDRLLIMAFCLFSGPALMRVAIGNIDPIILLLMTVGFLAIERGDDTTGGVLWAVAALFKLFPAFLGVWLLYRRAYKGIAAAVVTGVSGIIAGLAVFGVQAHIDFVNFIVNVRSHSEEFAGGLDPNEHLVTLRRPLSHLFPFSSRILLVISLLLIMPFVYLAYRNADSELDSAVAYFTTVIALLLTIVPATPGYAVYLFFPLVPLLYLTESQRAKYCFIAGIVLTSMPLYPVYIASMLGALPLAASTVAAIMSGVLAVLTYISVGLIGFLLIFAGCLFHIGLRPEINPQSSRDSGQESGV